GERPRLRNGAAAVLEDHRQRALRQVAEVIGEIGVDAIDYRFGRIMAILPEHHFAHEKVAYRFAAVGFDEIERVDDVADRLRHLLTLVQAKTLAEHTPPCGERR